ncbi:Aspartyl/glutamyl-tRNA(Asn/Gln) amidotransferase subunit B [Acidipropionibacterium acidipropionici ATCC 4875]|uniref:Aspartyl/glutamyl-tRNA(Asn/Gln) amidotransferase subunit B n=1 Tax=Acidipropionibacterium acidipropionici (strain ATCC 4875 / DSM 20272 / JCM 6432 / NBRC 12425 / NCIMB 8070 / 4) TaxID=1171373 RepID=K7S4Z9_ACIA4|nr:Asp-tRNA(Asn)/Glu-tRNA(Gln) amidotransferase subunit GatB [Acidipropionibacterium acidipropionici]AFV89697.1 Aspartyl/glutamyl-tRNA(Asn/Gln) amidotransferase subunit B [Acidipropionibacterium acidipropionici ATCC 4875]ALN15922.1 glutamyl-tRNA amidotransferase [Acidipropionibacterium acidipropionici]APZ08330.1 aspartyl/glutamyl-tRNA amidotransferase subunit B [Acidipropionibacterium acidipropionici]
MSAWTTDDLLDYDEAMERFDPVLGLEVHVELSTASKMFCGCPADSDGADPNTHVCPVCLGLPGSMPAINGHAVESAIRIGLALNCQIAPWCRMARKNYFYPDMTKDYQTSQYDEPICHDGHVDLEVDGKTYRVEIERAHMEEDAGKSLHVGGSEGRIQGAAYSLMDYNRAGVPLIEIVTKPVRDLGAAAPKVARAYMAHLRDIMIALGVSNARMEKGNLRCDANVSLMPKGSDVLGTRTETKNVNSLRSVEGALTYEIRRQAAVLASGRAVRQQTRMWQEDGEYTIAGRDKSDAEDYRYFPEPDLVPIEASDEWVEELRATLPELPAAKRARLAAEWSFSELEMDAVVNAGALDLIEATVAAGADAASARKWWLTELSRRANEAGCELAEVGMSPAQVAAVQKMVDAGTLTDKLARQVIDGVLAGEGEPDQVVAARGLAVVSDDGALGQAVDDAIAANPDVAEKIRGGKVQAAGALIGQVMKAMRGQADAKRVREIIIEKLS